MTINARIKSLTNNIASRVGMRALFGLTPIEQLESLRTFARDYRRAYERARPAAGPRVVLFNPIGYSFQTVVTGLLAHALALRGARTEIVICDGIVPQCERRTIAHDGGQADCRACIGTNATAFDALRLRYRRLSEFATPSLRAMASDRIDGEALESLWNLRIEDLPTGGMAYAGALRYFYQGAIDTTDELQSRVARDFLRSSAIISLVCPPMFRSLAPERVIMVDGVYTYTGLYSHYARRQGVPAYVWLRGYKKDTISISLGGNEGEVLPLIEDDRWARELTGDESRQLDEYLESRKTGSRDYKSFIENPVLDTAVVARELGLDPTKKTIGVFTNVGWDVAVLFKEAAFDRLEDWLITTIRVLSNMDVQVVLRVHPYEADAWNRTRHGAIAVLREAFGTIPANVHIIPPESKLSSYALIPCIDGAAVFSSKVGLELACCGKAVLTGGLALYRGKGFTLDVPTSHEYVAALRTLPDQGPLPAEKVSRARSFAHYYFFRRYLPLYALANMLATNPTAGLCELLPGHDRVLDELCDAILNGRDCEVPQAVLSHS